MVHILLRNEVNAVKIFGKNISAEGSEKKLLGCCDGIVARLKDSKNDIVSSGILGEGFAVYPLLNEHNNSTDLAVDLSQPDRVSVTEISSPVSGRVLDISSKPEAVIIKTDDGLKVLVSFFDFASKSVYISVRCGDLVKAGSQIADVKIDSENRAVYVIVENSDLLSKFEVNTGRTSDLKAAAEYTL